MGWEPITHCRDCGDPLDVYQPYEDRYCEACIELKPRVAAFPITEEEIPESKWNDRPTEPGEWGDEGYRNCEKRD